MKKITALISVTIYFICISIFAADKNQKLILVLDWFTNPNHVPIFIAQEKGFFQEQKLDVEIIVPSNPSDPPKWVATNKADMAIDYQPNWLLQVGRGLSLQQVGSLIDRPLNALAVLANGPIKQLSDLKGKDIASASSQIDAIMLQTMLEHDQLKMSDVRIINVGFNLTQALLSKRVDAVIGVTRNVEPVEMQELGHPVQLFYPEQYGFPFYDELIFVINKKNMHDIRVQKFFVALQKGISYAQRHPEESWQLFIKNHPELNNAKNQKIWQKTWSSFASEPTNWQGQRCLALAKFLQTKVENKIDLKVCDKNE